MSSSYLGWPNRVTWAIYLHLSSDEYTYNSLVDLVNRSVRYFLYSCCDEYDRHPATVLQREVEVIVGFDDAIDKMNSVLSDLLKFSWSEVDWNSLVSAFLSDEDSRSAWREYLDHGIRPEECGDDSDMYVDLEEEMTAREFRSR